MQIELTLAEAMLLDFVLSIDARDRDACARYLERYGTLRQANARVLLSGGGMLDFEDGDLESLWLAEVAMMVPIFHVIGGERVGLNLKLKLYRVLYGGISDADLERLVPSSHPTGRTPSDKPAAGL